MGKSAWTKGLKGAPKDRKILVRHERWDCPCVVEWMTFDKESWWGFSERLLSDVDGALFDDIQVECEWAEIPK